MTSQDDKIIIDSAISLEERARRLQTEVERLARLPVVEWRFYLEQGDIPAKYGIASVKLKEMIEAVIAADGKKAREAKADDRREKREAERKQGRDDRLSRQEKQREDRLARQEAERARKEAERFERQQEARRKKREAAFAEIAALPKLTQ